MLGEVLTAAATIALTTGAVWVTVLKNNKKVSADIQAKFDEIDKRITLIEKAVYGNGREGLWKSISRMDDRVRNLELGQAKLIEQVNLQQNR